MLNYIKLFNIKNYITLIIAIIFTEVNMHSYFVKFNIPLSLSL